MLNVTPFWEQVLRRTNAAAVRVMLGIESILPSGPADGDFLVGDGTDWVQESGATARASMGLGDIAEENAPLSVGKGGTGAASLTDGGVLLGSGTGAITAMLVLADGEFIVGDGAGDPVRESGATVRTSIGLGTGDVATFAETRLASQPSFLAFNSALDSNVTGTGTQATVDFDTEVFDQGADFTGDTFTAPVTGRYLLQYVVHLSAITSAADDIRALFVTSNREIRGLRWALADSLPTTFGLNSSVTADLDANDTVTVAVRVDGEASDVVGVDGNASILVTFFSGCLLA